MLTAHFSLQGSEWEVDECKRLPSFTSENIPAPRYLMTLAVLKTSLAANDASGP